MLFRCTLVRGGAYARKVAAVRVSDAEIDRAMAAHAFDDVPVGTSYAESRRLLRASIAHKLAREHAARRWYGPRGRWRPAQPDSPHIGEVCVSSLRVVRGDEDVPALPMTFAPVLEAVTPRSTLLVEGGWT